MLVCFIACPGFGISYRTQEFVYENSYTPEMHNLCKALWYIVKYVWDNLAVYTLITSLYVERFS